MAQPVIVEVLDDQGRVRHRSAVHGLPATIGRAYSNDVILDDPYVCPRHARIARSGRGALVVEDVGSVNGVRDESGARVQQAVVGDGQALRLGRTRVRVRAADHDVPPALRDVDAASAIPRRLAPARVSLGIVVAAFAAFAAAAYLDSVTRITAGEIARDATGTSLAVLLWAAGWSVASRIVVHEFRLLRLWAVMSAAVVAFQLIDSARGWLSFALPDSGMAELTAGTLLLVLVPAVLYAHLVIVSPLSRSRARRALLFITAAATAIVLLFSLAGRSGRTSGIEYESRLEPVGARWVHTVSLDEFTRGAIALRHQADELATEP